MQGDQAKDFLRQNLQNLQNKIVGWGVLEELYQVVNRLQMTSLDFSPSAQEKILFIL